MSLESNSDNFEINPEKKQEIKIKTPRFLKQIKDSQKDTQIEAENSSWDAEIQLFAQNDGINPRAELSRSQLHIKDLPEGTQINIEINGEVYEQYPEMSYGNGTIRFDHMNIKNGGLLNIILADGSSKQIKLGSKGNLISEAELSEQLFSTNSSSKTEQQNHGKNSSPIHENKETKTSNNQSKPLTITEREAELAFLEINGIKPNAKIDQDNGTLNLNNLPASAEIKIITDTQYQLEGINNNGNGTQRFEHINIKNGGMLEISLQDGDFIIIDLGKKGNLKTSELSKYLKIDTTKNEQSNKSSSISSIPETPKKEKLTTHTNSSKHELQQTLKNNVVQYNLAGGVSFSLDTNTIQKGKISLQGLPTSSKVNIIVDNYPYAQYPSIDPKTGLLKYNNMNIKNGGTLEIDLGGAVITADLKNYKTQGIQIDSSEYNNTSSLEKKLTMMGVLKNSRIHRDPNHSEYGLQTTYIVGEYAIYLLNSGKIQEAKTVVDQILNDGIITSLKKSGRVTRLYYPDGNGDGGVGKEKGYAATNGDCSVLSIALGKYLKLTQNQANDEFRKQVIEANNLIQDWLNNKLEGYGPTITVNGKNHKAFRVMSDDNANMDGIKTKWENSIAVENEARRMMSLWYAGKPELAQKSLQALIDASWDGNTKQFCSGIDTATGKGKDGEYARDALSLMVLAADMMGIMTAANKDKFIQAAKTKPAYSMKDGAFGYSYDHKPGEVSVIPEFMYLDAAALKILGLEDMAKQTMKISDKWQGKLGGSYSTEYQSAPYNPIGDIMRTNADQFGNYYG